jgi:5'-nucleotidase / UDP-sugar diphosphatase
MSIVEIALVPTASPFRVAVPARLARPSHRTFIRRRLALAVALLAALVVPAVAAAALATDRGGAPAPAATIRPTNAAGAAPASVTYVVRPGDTLWSIAQLHRGTTSRGAYVDALIDTNGGASILVGQRLVLP